MTNEENEVRLDRPELLYRAEDAVEAALYAQALDNAGIRSHQAGGRGSLAFGELGPDVLRVDVYVGEADLEAGKRVIEEYQAQRPERAEEPQAAWICASCGEESDGDFGRCWKCGATRS